MDTEYWLKFNSIIYFVKDGEKSLSANFQNVQVSTLLFNVDENYVGSKVLKNQDCFESLFVNDGAIFNSLLY